MKGKLVNPSYKPYSQGSSYQVTFRLLLPSRIQEGSRNSQSGDTWFCWRGKHMSKKKTLIRDHLENEAQMADKLSLPSSSLSVKCTVSSSKCNNQIRIQPIRRSIYSSISCTRYHWVMALNTCLCTFDTLRSHLYQAHTRGDKSLRLVPASSLACFETGRSIFQAVY